MTPKPNRRVTALATLAFASAVTGGSASTAAATNATPRGKAQNTRATAKPAAATTTAGDARLQLPAALDVDGLAAELGVHPGRLAAALRRIAPDETRSIGGLDPLTALARQLDLPPTEVYLAAARHAAGRP